MAQTPINQFLQLLDKIKRYRHSVKLQAIYKPASTLQTHKAISSRLKNCRLS